MKKSLHSICRWTFSPGKGGFVPGNIRPDWNFDTPDVIHLIKEQIVPRMPEHVCLGFEVHYDTEVNEKNAAAVADALVDAGIYLAMITPGAHSHFGYGGISALDPSERSKAEELGMRAVDLAYGPLRKAWHPETVPTFVLWNGSYGYDLASVAIQNMYQNLKESVAKLCKYEEKAGGKLYFGIEPKPNEGHPAMLLPTVASALLFWKKLESEFGVTSLKKGVNKEFGHTEMIGLDPVYDTIEELDNNAVVHMHLNSQGYNDGIILGGPGKYDIDHGTRINGANIAIARLLQDAGFNRWKGHDMLVRPYDDPEQGIDRIVRSILSWEACAQAAQEMDTNLLLDFLAKRQTAKAEDLIRASIIQAYRHFDAMIR